MEIMGLIDNLMLLAGVVRMLSLVLVNGVCSDAEMCQGVLAGRG